MSLNANDKAKKRAVQQTEIELSYTQKHPLYSEMKKVLLSGMDKQKTNKEKYSFLLDCQVELTVWKIRDSENSTLQKVYKAFGLLLNPLISQYEQIIEKENG